MIYHKILLFYTLQIEITETRILLLNNFAQDNYSDIDIETIPGDLPRNIPNRNFGTTSIIHCTLYSNLN